MADSETTPDVSSDIHPLYRRFIRICELLSAAMFAALFLTFVAQVFFRYVLREPLVWSLEVAGLLFVAVSLFTAATQMPLREHVSLDLFMDLFSSRVAGILRGLSLLTFAGVMFLSVPDTIRVLEWMYKERTFALRFNLGHLFVLMIFFVLAYAIRAVFDAIRQIRNGADAGEY